jgi:hypothetical protein
MTYDDRFYGAIKDTTIRSAETIVPIVLTHLSNIDWHVDSVVDVGGGQGWWAKAFHDFGVRQVLCMDGAYVRDPVVPFQRQDLETPIYRGEHFGLAVCLEVGEHLSPRRAGPFIMELTSFAPVVLFSAAIPEQGGNNHVNEQPPAYWSSLFNENGFVVSGYLRDLIWDDTSVASWYRQNLLLALHRRTFEGALGMPAGFYSDMPPMERIHPATGNPRLKELRA